MLKIWITEAGGPQSKVADALGVSHGYFSGLVNGNKKPSLEIAMRISLLTGGRVGLSSWFTPDELEALKVVDAQSGASACGNAEPLKAAG